MCLHAWQNESTFEKHDHISNVAATFIFFLRFAGTLEHCVLLPLRSVRPGTSQAGC